VEAPRQGLRAKMSDTRVAEIDFRETRIADVVDFLRNASRAFDPAKEPGQRKGINFVLNLRRSADDGAQEAAVPPITFKARDISLLEVLDVVTQVAGLKYRVEGNVVIIVPRDAPDGPILQRSYTVIPAVGEKARKVQDEMK
jgi:hypothetical protein